MMTRKSIIVAIIMVGASGRSADLHAMDASFGRKAIERAVTTMSAVSVGQMLEESHLHEEIKVPLFIGLFTAGTFGFDVADPAPLVTTTAKLLTALKTASALAGSWYIIDNLQLSDRNKSTIMAGLCGIHLWRICRAQQGQSSDK